jgi:hypothetical protein
MSATSASSTANGESQKSSRALETKIPQSEILASSRQADIPDIADVSLEQKLFSGKEMEL